MGFRGLGGYGGAHTAPIFERRSLGGRRVMRLMAGDIFDTFGGGTDTTGLDTTGVSSDLPPDFSDVQGGSSTTVDPTFTTMGGLGDVATALGPYLGGVGSAIFSPTVKNLLGTGAEAGPAIGMGSAVGTAVRRALGGHRARGGLSVGRAHRRMNPGNFKALRRSMRRLKSFETAARHVIHFTHPKPTARVKFRFHRKRRR